MKISNTKTGISLIVLVITIIIMIILAAAIIITLSNTGIINQAEKGTNAYSENDLKHKVSLILGDAVVEKVNTRKDIVTYVAEHEEVDEVVDNEETFTIAMDGYIITINKQTLEIEDMAKDTAFRQETRGKASFVLEPATGYSKTVKVSIEVDADLPTGLEVQYNLVESSKDSTNWITYTSGQIAELTKNQTVYGRIINSTTKEIGYNFRKEITAIETEVPNKAEIVLDKKLATADETVTATVTQSDEKSGIDITKCKYIVNTSSELLGVDNTSWSSATAFTTNPQALSITQTETGKYYIHVLSVDKLGNMKETVSEGIQIKGATVYYYEKFWTGSTFTDYWDVTEGTISIWERWFGAYKDTTVILKEPINVDEIDRVVCTAEAMSGEYSSSTYKITFSLIKNMDSTENVVSTEFVRKAYGDYVDVNMSLDTTNLSGEYYIKMHMDKGSRLREWIEIKGQ